MDNVSNIRLINIDLSQVSFEQQVAKVDEEEEEFEKALEGTDKEHIMEEFFDLVQSKMGLLQYYGINSQRLMNYYPKHLEKMRNRPRNE